MATENHQDDELIARLRRLDAAAADASPGFNYDGMFERHGAARERSRRRLVFARGAAGAVLLALVGASFWRLDQDRSEVGEVAGEVVANAPAKARSPEPRIVRADTYLAVVALEDHIANLDDALNYARVAGAQADVVRLERTRAELVDSYRRVRYADMVSANF
jgi:hypothetical protein